MKKFLIAVMLVLSLAGCVSREEYTAQQESKSTIDQCLRNQIFQQCLATIPPGPQKTVYNDWNEVVSECASVSYSQSFRVRSQVKQECRSD
ncbi:hypothetical protein [Xanthomonas phage BUDD]|nr:hypothetical protein [Xanthomonas phage BUDD]